MIAHWLSTNDLISSKAPEARAAFDLFAFHIARETDTLATTLGGLDGIVFTAGIGEHQPQNSEGVCRYLAWLGVAIDPAANAQDAARIEAFSSKVALLVIPTDEEQVIAEEACAVLKTRESCNDADRRSPNILTSVRESSGESPVRATLKETARE